MLIMYKVISKIPGLFGLCLVCLLASCTDSLNLPINTTGNINIDFDSLQHTSPYRFLLKSPPLFTADKDIQFQLDLNTGLSHSLYLDNPPAGWHISPGGLLTAGMDSVHRGILNLRLRLQSVLNSSAEYADLNLAVASRLIDSVYSTDSILDYRKSLGDLPDFILRSFDGNSSINKSLLIRSGYGEHLFADWDLLSIGSIYLAPGGGDTQWSFNNPVSLTLYLPSEFTDSLVSLQSVQVYFSTPQAPFNFIPLAGTHDSATRAITVTTKDIGLFTLAIPSWANANANPVISSRATTYELLQNIVNLPDNVISSRFRIYAHRDLAQIWSWADTSSGLFCADSAVRLINNQDSLTASRLSSVSLPDFPATLYPVYISVEELPLQPEAASVHLSVYHLAGDNDIWKWDYTRQRFLISQASAVSNTSDPSYKIAASWYLHAAAAEFADMYYPRAYSHWDNKISRIQLFHSSSPLQQKWNRYFINYLRVYRALFDFASFPQHYKLALDSGLQILFKQKYESTDTLLIKFSQYLVDSVALPVKSIDYTINYDIRTDSVLVLHYGFGIMKDSAFLQPDSIGTYHTDTARIPDISLLPGEIIMTHITPPAAGTPHNILWQGDIKADVTAGLYVPGTSTLLLPGKDSVLAIDGPPYYLLLVNKTDLTKPVNIGKLFKFSY